jgi:hypothetical protein
MPVTARASLSIGRMSVGELRRFAATIHERGDEKSQKKRY